MHPSLANSLILLVTLSVSSCVAPPQPQLTCAPIAIRDGKHVILDRAEFNRVAPKLSAHLAQKGLILIPDVATADRLVTIAYVPDPGAPGLGTLHVLDIAGNTFNSQRPGRPQRKELPISASRDAASSFPQISRHPD